MEEADLCLTQEMRLRSRDEGGVRKGPRSGSRQEGVHRAPGMGWCWVSPKCRERSRGPGVQAGPQSSPAQAHKPVSRACPKAHRRPQRTWQLPKPCCPPAHPHQVSSLQGAVQTHQGAIFTLVFSAGVSPCGTLSFPPSSVWHDGTERSARLTHGLGCAPPPSARAAVTPPKSASQLTPPPH